MACVKIKKSPYPEMIFFKRSFIRWETMKHLYFQPFIKIGHTICRRQNNMRIISKGFFYIIKQRHPIFKIRFRFLQLTKPIYLMALCFYFFLQRKPDRNAIRVCYIYKEPISHTERHLLFAIQFEV